jgi:hypothetical protein
LPLTYNAQTVNDRLADVVTNIDAGAGFGLIRLLTATAQTVGIITLNKPCGTVSGGVLTFSGLPLAAPLTLISGDITAADIEDSNSTVVASGLTVGGSTAYDILMAVTTVSSGQVISLSYATITGR